MRLRLHWDRWPWAYKMTRPTCVLAEWVKKEQFFFTKTRQEGLKTGGARKNIAAAIWKFIKRKLGRTELIKVEAVLCMLCNISKRRRNVEGRSMINYSCIFIGQAGESIMLRFQLFRQKLHLHDIDCAKRKKYSTHRRPTGFVPDANMPLVQPPLHILLQSC